MFFVITILLFAAMAVFCATAQLCLESLEKKHGKSCDNFGWGATCLILGFFTLLITVIMLIVSLVNNSHQRYDQEDLTKVSQFQEIYKKRTDNLTGQFVHYLAQIYPEYEKNIFEKITPNDLDIYLVKYPDLKASETIIQLVKQIRDLNDDIYQQELRRAEILRDMRFRTRNPWILQWLMPNTPIPTE